MHLHFFSSAFIKALGWALLHSLWQALLVLGCLQFLLFSYRHSSASIRHNAAMIALGSIFTWFVLTLVQEWKAHTNPLSANVSMMQQVPVSESHQFQERFKNQTNLLYLFPELENYFSWLVTIYFAGILYCLARLAADFAYLQRIGTREQVNPDLAWISHLQSRSRQMQLKRPVQLYLSRLINVPLMIGYLKPVIYLPLTVANNLSPEQIDAILLHELAHIQRNDYLLNIFQTLVETILFFNPFVRRISTIVRRERENSCDDKVLTILHNPLLYATALVSLAECQVKAHHLAMASTNNEKQLFHRIKRMMEMKTQRLTDVQKLLALLLVTAGIASIAWLNPSTSSNKANAAKTNPPFIARKTAMAVWGSSTMPPTTTPVVMTGDTTPSQPRKKEPSGDDKHNQKEKKGLNENLSNPDLEKTAEASAIAEEAIKKINLEQLQEDIKMSMATVNWSQEGAALKKAMEEMKKSIAKINWQKQEGEIKKAMKEMKKNLKNIDWAVQKENLRKNLETARTALEQMNWDSVHEEIRRELEIVKKNSNSNELQKAIHKAKLDMAKAMHTVQMEIRKAQLEASSNHRKTTMAAGAQAEKDDRQLQAFTDALKKDGLLGDNKQYKIERKENDLYINGVKQSREVADKYRQYLDGRSFIIEKNDDHVKKQVTDDPE